VHLLELPGDGLTLSDVGLSAAVTFWRAEIERTHAEFVTVENRLNFANKTYIGLLEKFVAKSLPTTGPSRADEPPAKRVCTGLNSQGKEAAEAQEEGSSDDSESEGSE
jgi:hypothetical protein